MECEDHRNGMRGGKLIRAWRRPVPRGGGTARAHIPPAILITVPVA